MPDEGSEDEIRLGKLGDAKDLPSVEQAEELIANRMTDKLRGLICSAESEDNKRQQDMLQQKQQLKERQRARCPGPKKRVQNHITGL